MKTVSFVMPVYNPPEEPFRRQLDSIFGQGGVGIELVAVDDGSSGDTVSVLREYEMRFPGTMKIVRQENRGQGPARNEGFRHTTGDYIWFVDADDLVRPGAAAHLVGILDETGAEWISFEHQIAFSGHERPFPADWTGTVNRTSPTRELAEKRSAPWACLLRKDFLERIGVRFCDAKTGEDIVEIFRWSLESSFHLRTDEPCYRYILRAGSVVNSQPDVRFFTKGWQVMDLFDDLARRHPAYASWINLWNFLRARGHVRRADRYLKDEAGHCEEDREAVRLARDEYLRRLSLLDADSPLVAFYDRSRAQGRLDMQLRLIDVQNAAKRLKEGNASLKKKAAALRAKNDVLSEKLAAAKEKASASARSLEAARASRAQLSERLAAAKRTAAERSRCIEAMHASLSWRITAPLRAIMGLLVRK